MVLSNMDLHACHMGWMFVLPSPLLDWSCGAARQTFFVDAVPAAKQQASSRSIHMSTIVTAQIARRYSR